MPKKLTRNAEKKRIRARLWAKQGGLCYYCKKPMRLFTQMKGGACPPDTCTLEHLIDRYDPRRRQYTKDPRYAAACYECNWNRNKERTAALPLEEKRRRSQGRDSFEITSNNDNCLVSSDSRQYGNQDQAGVKGGKV